MISIQMVVANSTSPLASLTLASPIKPFKTAGKVFFVLLGRLEGTFLIFSFATGSLMSRADSLLTSDTAAESEVLSNKFLK